MARKPGSRIRNYDIEPSTNEFGPKAVNPHSPWQLVIEKMRTEKKLPLRKLATLVNIPTGTLFNWTRSKKGVPSRSSYTTDLNSRFAAALDIPEQELLDAYNTSAITSAKPKPISIPRHTAFRQQQSKQNSPMPALSVVCYPHSFLERPVDRLFASEIASTNIPQDSAKLILYRMWADFASGASDRRLIGSVDFAQDKQIRILEAFCGWNGGHGELIRMAVESGFLKVETSPRGIELICVGFYPINSAWSSNGTSFQKRGAYCRVMQRELDLAKNQTAMHPELWTGTTAIFSDELPETIRQEAVQFIFRIYNLLKTPIPNDSDSIANPASRAVELLQNTSQKQIDDTFVWLLSRRKIPGIPLSVDAILREWPDYEKQSGEEIV